MARSRRQADAAGSDGDRVKARVTATAVGWREDDDSKTQFADHGDVVLLPKAEFERLEALGTVEKAGRSDKLSGGEEEGASSTAERAAETLVAEGEEPDVVRTRQ